MIAVGIVTARGGSKGVPRKNIRLLAGKPLLAYTSEAARAARALERTVLTTDDAEIAEVGRDLGLEVPFLRPAELATDAARSVDVLVHAAQWLEDTWDYRPDAFVLLQPTAPLRTAADIDAAVQLLASGDADSVVSVCRVPEHFAPAWQLQCDDAGALRLLTGDPLGALVSRRQDLPATYYRNGAVYVVRRQTLLGQRSLYGKKTLAYRMPAERSVNIDSPDDFSAAETSLRRLQVSI